MPGPGTASRHENDLVFLLGLDKPVQDGEHRLRSPINNALPPDFHHIDFRMHPEILFGLGPVKQFFTHEGLAHQVGFNVQPSLFSLFFNQFCHAVFLSKRCFPQEDFISSQPTRDIKDTLLLSYNRRRACPTMELVDKGMMRTCPTIGASVDPLREASLNFSNFRR